jgi:hypothetical protein
MKLKNLIKKVDVELKSQAELLFASGDFISLEEFAPNCYEAIIGGRAYQHFDAVLRG